MTTKQAHTYLRDLVPAERMGQCSCCLRWQRSTKRGTLARHGWKEAGRRIGEHGNGFQWGKCRGGAMRPLETTDADALVILGELAAHIILAQKDLTHHAEEGEDSYPYRFSQRRDGDQPDSKLALILTTEYPTEASEERKRSRRGYDVIMRVYELAVERGREERTVTRDELTGNSYDSRQVTKTVLSYAQLRQERVRLIEREIEGLEKQRDQIKASIIRHREKPSNGRTDTVKRGPVTHFKVMSPSMTRTGFDGPKKALIYCGSRAWQVKSSEVKGEVTCSRCRKRLSS